jgi:hypothetical protein
MRIRSVVGATVATTVAVLLAVSGLPAPVAAAALSLSVEPTEAPPGSMVRVSGGCTEGWSDSETGLRIAAETVSVDLVPIPLEEGNTFSSVPVTIPESMEPGEYRLYTACDAETPFTVLPPPPAAAASATAAASAAASASASAASASAVPASAVTAPAPARSPHADGRP